MAKRRGSFLFVGSIRRTRRESPARYVDEHSPTLEDPRQIGLFSAPHCARCGCSEEKPCREGCSLRGPWCVACLAAAGEVKP